MSSLEEKRALAEKAKETVYRKRFISKKVEHVGTTVLGDDGKAQGYKANPGEFHTIRLSKVWGNVLFNSGTDNAYNPEASKANCDNFKMVKGFEPDKVDEMANNKKNVKAFSAARAAGSNVNN